MVVNVCECIPTFIFFFFFCLFVFEAGFHSFNQIFRKIFFPLQILRAVDLGLSQSIDLCLVVN